MSKLDLGDLIARGFESRGFESLVEASLGRSWLEGSHASFALYELRSKRIPEPIHVSERIAIGLCIAMYSICPHCFRLVVRTGANDWRHMKYASDHLSPPPPQGES